ncbi:MAG TPA: GNAT family N-acetyltransferase, partial [Polyangia bacterium]
MTIDFDWGISLPRLVGKRVDLRALDGDDVAALLAIFGDPEVVKFWSAPPLESREGAVALLAQIQNGFSERRLFQWGISLRSTGEVLGTCTLYNLDLEHRRAEIGFALRRS